MANAKQESPEANPVPAKASAAPAAPALDEDCVLMTRKGDADAVVNHNSVAIMEALGWKVKKA